MAFSIEFDVASIDFKAAYFADLPISLVESSTIFSGL